MLIYDVVEEIPANTVNSGSRLQLVEYTPTDEEVANILYDTSSVDNSDRNSPPASTGGTRGTGAIATTGGNGGTPTTPVATGGTGATPQTRTVTVNGVTYTINTLGTPEQSDDTIVIDGVTYDANSYINRKEEEAKQEQLLNNGAADGSTGEKTGSSNPTPEETKKVEVVEPCIQKTDETGSTGGNASTGGAGGTGGIPNTQDDTTPIIPRIVKKGKSGTFKASTKNKNAPLIFVVGGVSLPAKAVPGISPGDNPNNKDKKEGYMWTGYTGTGYNDLQEFNIYNCLTSQTSKAGWSECEKILNEQKIKPSKYILVLYSGGVAAGHSSKGVLSSKPANEWDQIHISGPPLGAKNWGVDRKTFDKYLQTVSKAGKDKVYYWAVGKGSAEGADEVGWKTELINALPPSNVNTGVGNHFTQIQEVSQGIKNNNPIEEGKKSEVVVTEPKKPEKVCDDLTKVDAKIKANEGPQGGAEVVTEARETSDGQQKPADPKAPKKTEEPSYSGQLNHRFYLRPTPEGIPATLQDMTKEPWSKRYFAWRPESGPGFGDKKYENLVTTPDGKPLISGMIPYWPPVSAEEETKGPQGKKGKWIQSPTINGSSKNLQMDDAKCVWDIPILLNVQDVGHFNKTIGYLFEAGNELHMAIMPDSLVVSAKNSGISIGTSLNTQSPPIVDEKGKTVPAKDSSWALWPQWDSYFVKFALEKVGYTLYESIENINAYHLGVIKRKRTSGLINTPGTQKWKIDDLVKAGTKDGIFKPSKVWTENQSSQETIATEGDMAIFVADYHFTKDGALTDAGKNLVNHILTKTNWQMATICAVSHHASESSNCHIEILPYLDSIGNIKIIGGNTTPKKSDPSLPAKSTIAIKDTNFAEFAGIDNGNWVNGAVIITNVKSVPKQEQRETKNLSSKFYRFSTIQNYLLKIDSDKDVSPSLFNVLSPILSDKTPPPPPQPPPKPQGGGTGKAGYDAGTIVLNSSIRQPVDARCIGTLSDLGSVIGVWGGIIQKLTAYWNSKAASNPMYANAVIGSLGSSRSLWESSYTKASNRVCGSKHGIGMAFDLKHKFDFLQPKPATGGGLVDGPALFACKPWMADMKDYQRKNGLTGGADWNDSLEPHHIEATDARMPEFLYGCRNQLQNEFGIDHKTVTKQNPTLVKVFQSFCGAEANKYAWRYGYSTPREGAYQCPKKDFEPDVYQAAVKAGTIHTPWKKSAPFDQEPPPPPRASKKKKK